MPHPEGAFTGGHVVIALFGGLIRPTKRSTQLKKPTMLPVANKQHLLKLFRRQGPVVSVRQRRQRHLHAGQRCDIGLQLGVRGLRLRPGRQRSDHIGQRRQHQGLDLRLRRRRAPHDRGDECGRDHDHRRRGFHRRRRPHHLQRRCRRRRHVGHLRQCRGRRHQRRRHRHRPDSTTPRPSTAAGPTRSRSGAKR